jgi:hypothetical protein
MNSAGTVSARGELGVAEVLALLKRELSVTMTLLGVERIDQIGAGALDGSVGKSQLLGDGGYRPAADRSLGEADQFQLELYL